MIEKNDNVSKVQQCPKCHNLMQQKSPRNFDCQTCQQSYYEIYICPICNKELEQIKGCGAINYLCLDDGLISSTKVIFHYLAQLQN